MNDGRKMKILFATLHWGYLRNFDPVIRELAADGHEILLAADMREKFGNRPMIDELVDEYPNVSADWSPTDFDSYETEFTTYIRHGIHYMRLLKPEYADRHLLRRSMARRTPDFLVRLAHRSARKGRARRFEDGLRRLEASIRVPSDWIEFLARERPDVVLITPLVGMSEAQFDPLRAANRLGIRTVYCASGWDHLSSKALIRFDPGRVLVWNETQKDEAMQMHDIPEERIAITGAPGFDKWFDREPSRSREDFCGMVGLDPSRTYVVYLCSALFRGSPSEADFVRGWIEQIRTSDHPGLRDVGVLVRPHPQRSKLWRGVSLESFENVAFWGDNPVEEESENDFYDSMVHAAAAVGLNTTALIDAAVVGKPVHTITLPKFHENQAGTIHFHYMLNVEGGFLRRADDLPEHLRQLAGSVERDGEIDERSRRFTESFVRPQGLESASTPIFVEELEKYVETPAPEPTRVRPSDLLLRYSVIYPAMGLAYFVTFAPLRKWNARARKRLIDVVRSLSTGRYLRTLEKKLVPSSYVLVRSFWRIDASRKGRFRALFDAAGRGENLPLSDTEVEAPPPGFLLRYPILYPFVFGSYPYRLLIIGRSAWSMLWHRFKKRVRFVYLKGRSAVMKVASLCVRVWNHFRQVPDA